MAVLSTTITAYLYLLVVSVSAIDLRIWSDYQPQLGLDGSINSYSGVIEFTDPTIPSNPEIMTDDKFSNLASVAYTEMVLAHASQELPSRKLPGAMMAMESGGRIYFASSVTKNDRVDLATFGADIPGSIGFFQTNCNYQFGTHRTGGACAEPNTLRLYGDVNADPAGGYARPPVTPTGPRIVVFGRNFGEPVGQNRERVKPPCNSESGAGWGCEKFVTEFGLKPILGGTPYPVGQDDWAFTYVPNPRQSCYEDENGAVATQSGNATTAAGIAGGNTNGTTAAGAADSSPSSEQPAEEGGITEIATGTIDPTVGAADLGGVPTSKLLKRMVRAFKA